MTAAFLSVFLKAFLAAFCTEAHALPTFPPFPESPEVLRMGPMVRQANGVIVRGLDGVETPIVYDCFRMKGVTNRIVGVYYMFASPNSRRCDA